MTGDSPAARVTVRLGLGNGTFQASKRYAVGANPQSVSALDVTGDGRPELFVGSQGSNTVSVLLNANGVFTAAAPLAGVAGPRVVAFGDFNRDGRADLATANAGDNTVGVFLGKGRARSRR